MTFMIFDVEFRALICSYGYIEFHEIDVFICSSSVVLMFFA